jgi:G protein beta subunit-like protein
MGSSVVLATAGYDHTIRFWEATSGICYRTLQYADSQVNKLEITADKSHIAAAGNPHIRLYEVNSNNPQPVVSFDGHASNVTAIGFQKDSKWMFSGGEDGTVRCEPTQTLGTYVSLCFCFEGGKGGGVLP